MFTLHRLGLRSLLPISTQDKKQSPSPYPYLSPAMCFSAYNDVLSYQTSPSELTTVLFKTAVTDPPPSKFMAFTTPQDMSRSANS